MTSYEPSGFFVLRSPLLPHEALTAWADGIQSPGLLEAGGGADQLDAAIRADRRLLRDRLDALLERPEVMEALFLASPDLRAGLDLWRRDPDGRRGQRVERAVVRYVERMASRSTPFGLFAGCAVGTVESRTRLRLQPHAAYRRHTRLDMLYLCTLIRTLEADPDVRTQLRYTPTSSLANVAHRWVWVELTPDDTDHSHRHHRRQATPALTTLVERAREGLTLTELERLDGFSPDLIERRFLVSHLEPGVTGPEPIHVLIDQLADLAAIPLAGAALETLRAVRDALDTLDTNGLGAAPAAYTALQDQLASLPATIEPARLWQAELIKTPDSRQDHAPLMLGQPVMDELLRGVTILHRLHWPRREQLQRFRDACIARFEGYEARREAPLAELLDPEGGIGFGGSTGHDGATPLLDGLTWPTEPSDPMHRSSDRFAVLFARVADAQAAGLSEIELTDADIDALANPTPPPLPYAFSATATLIAPGADAIDGGEFQLLLTGVAGPSGVRLAGRFSHGDETLRAQVQAHIRAEEELRPDAVYAEIAHLPEPRAGNILHRPVFRDFEIVYLAPSGVPLDRQIGLDDLRVTVDGERIILRSVRLGREVIPRLTSAQNYFHLRTIPLYRFLAALQDQGVAHGLGWDWGPLAFAPFLPRVRTGKVILARARWRLDRAEVDALASRSGADLLAYAQAWRTARGIPRQVRLVEYDNELLVDFANVLSIEGLAQVVRGQRAAVLVELLPDEDGLCVSGPEGHFFHELSVPFVRTADEPAASQTATTTAESGATPASASPAAISVTPVARLFPPGSEWLYAKLYAPPTDLDTLLRQVVQPLVDDALGSGAADGWFFIRYGDPDWHLRLRFHGEPARLLTEVLPRLRTRTESLLEARQVRRLQLDTYDRERERYGGPEGILLCERLFQADSEFALEIVGEIRDDDLPAARWRLALAGMSALLDGLGLADTEQLAVLQATRDAFGREHRADQKLLRQIGERYRAERISIDSLFTHADDRPAPGLAALSRLRARIAPTMTALREYADSGRLSLSLADLAPSLLHMHANRMLHTDARRQELVLYDLLARVVDARLARQRQSPRPSV